MHNSSNHFDLNGELKAAMQYMSQSFRIKDPAIKDLFMDIAAEELSHMEMVATTINLLNGHDVDYSAIGAGEIQKKPITLYSEKPLTAFNIQVQIKILGLLKTPDYTLTYLIRLLQMHLITRMQAHQVLIANKQDLD